MLPARRSPKDLPNKRNDKVKDFLVLDFTNEKSDRTVVAWGRNDLGQTNVPAGLNEVVAVSAGGYHNLALKSDSTVTAWGANWYDQTNVPEGLDGVIAVAAGGYHSLALK